MAATMNIEDVIEVATAPADDRNDYEREETKSNVRKYVRRASLSMCFHLHGTILLRMLTLVGRILPASLTNGAKLVKVSY